MRERVNVCMYVCHDDVYVCRGIVYHDGCYEDVPRRRFVKCVCCVCAIVMMHGATNVCDSGCHEDVRTS